jgi:hypothetical protein
MRLTRFILLITLSAGNTIAASRPKSRPLRRNTERELSAEFTDSTPQRGRTDVLGSKLITGINTSRVLQATAIVADPKQDTVRCCLYGDIEARRLPVSNRVGEGPRKYELDLNREIAGDCRRFGRN